MHGVCTPVPGAMVIYSGEKIRYGLEDTMFLGGQSSTEKHVLFVPFLGKVQRELRRGSG